ncbi:MAG TPA: hypothetical protein PLS81_12365 [Deltaproteobacteria bacterium]|nr:hypothetical protein [Deltaproteobacteria bacterium]HOM30233.1 hypothetical protein [Deltaproteobacteria bacterium]HPP79748.1 hypothetical protein [Deltaproteobacteria bacterium]
MKHRTLRLLVFVACVLASAYVFQGCSTGGDTEEEEPIETPDLSGVWWGLMRSELVFGVVVPLEGDDTGLEYRTMLVSDASAYISPVEDVYDAFPYDALPLRVVQENAAVIGGDLVQYEGGSLAYAAAVEEKLWLNGVGYEKSLLGGPLLGNGAVRFYRKDVDGELESGRVSQFVLYYNDAFEDAPNVRDLQGTWTLSGGWAFGNDMELTITPYVTTTTGGTVSGRDARGNTISGTIVIHATEPASSVYDLDLSLNGVPMSGLAAKIVFSESDENKPSGMSEGVYLVLCAASADFSRILGGLAEPE